MGRGLRDIGDLNRIQFSSNDVIQKNLNQFLTGHEGGIEQVDRNFCKRFVRRSENGETLIHIT